MKQRTHRLRILLIAACVAAICCAVGAVLAAEEQTEYIYFDLAAGNVTITGEQYTGYAYKRDGNTYAIEKISGTRTGNQVYYVYQSEAVNGGRDGYFTVDDESQKAFTIPKREQIRYDSKAWGDYVTNNCDVEAVINAWPQAANAAGRTATTHCIQVTGKLDAKLVIDNLWSSFQTGFRNTGRTDGGISFFPQNVKSHLTILTKGDNRFGNIFYGEAGETGSTLTFDELTLGSSLTVADFPEHTNGNFWNAAIGGCDATYENTRGLIFKGGTVFAGTTEADDCTAIGGGGNGFGGITITGGRITASVSSSGAAIGGGIGKTQPGGQANITISGGEVYAYNFSCKVGVANATVKYIPAAAIGGGSSRESVCKECTVTITGGKVYAQSVGGTAIGGGSSTNKYGGSAKVTIGGDAEVVAKSIAGVIDGQEVPAGAAIGGGTGGIHDKQNGGDVTLTIQDSAKIIAGSIGGGKTTSKTGTIGAATVKITGGTLQGQIIMAAGSSTKCSFEMSGGTIDNSGRDTAQFVFLNNNGGAIYMDDPNGIAKLFGGKIAGCTAENGGAVYMSAGLFELSGTGTITSCSATQSGGAVYMGGGTFTMSGGEMSSNRAANGAGAYLEKGTMTVKGGNISGNTASSNGGGAYLGGGEFALGGGTVSDNAAQDGAGAYVANGNVTVTGGTVSGNTAQNNGGAFSVADGDYKMTGGTIEGNKTVLGNGGAIYVSADSRNAEIVIRSGEITKNIAGTSGGALGVYGKNGVSFTVTLGSNTDHTDRDHEHACAGGGDDESCPIIRENTSTVSGGGIYFAGSYDAVMNMYCLVEQGNKVGSDVSLSDFMMVEGGTLKIGAASENENKQLGSIEIAGTIHVIGGRVTLEGTVSNPMFTGSVTVDIDEGKGSSFTDNRKGGNAYTIQYFEHFEENGKTSGRYTLVDDKGGNEHTIRAVMYSHTGYTAQGWMQMTNSGGTLTAVQLFTAGSTITVDQNLIFYAQWSVTGYTVYFEAGATEYQGEMQPQEFTYAQVQNLTKNAYIRVGYIFDCWYDKSNPQKTYTDEASVSKLSAIPGDTITLVAKWTICDHTASGCLTITATENSVSCTCRCQAYTEIISLSDVTVTYDGKVHEANVHHTWETKNGKSIARWSYTVEYSGTDNDDKPLVGLPCNAGDYVAKIKIDKTTIEAKIKINRAECPYMPAAPEYTVTKDGNNNIIQVTKPLDENNTYGLPLQYMFSWYEGSTLKDSEWQSPNGENFPSQSLDVAYTYYYVDVRYAQTCNYEASAPVRGASTIYWRGNVVIKIETGQGLSYSVIENENKSGITVTLTPQTGYYIYEIQPTITVPDGYGSPKLNKESETGELCTYNITDIQSSTTEKTITIQIHFSGVERRVSVSAGTAKDEVFGDLPNAGAQNVTISGDSAFTATFHVTHFKHYSGFTVKFTENLPVGSTVIMIDRSAGSYWCYTATEEKRQIPLADFVRMGTTGEKFTVSGDTLNLQFVVDFSDCKIAMTPGELRISLAATLERSTMPEMPTDAAAIGTVTVKETPSFSVSLDQSEGDMTQSVSYRFGWYGESNVGISKWESVSGILWILPTSDTVLPSDARLKVTIGNATTIYAMTNSGFAVKIPSIGTGTATITLLSDMLPDADKTLMFDVLLMASATTVSTTPSVKLNNTSVQIGYTLSKAVKPAINAELENAFPKYNGESVEALTVTGKVQELPGTYSLQAVIYSKNTNGEYADTSFTTEIKLTGEESSFEQKISLDFLKDAMESEVGSLSCMLRVEILDANRKTVDFVPLYFIVVNSKQ